MGNKKMIIMAIIILSVSCKPQNDDIKTITAFMKNVVIDSSDNIDDMHSFVKINKDSLQEHTKTRKLIQLNLQFLRDELKAGNNEFEILPFKEFKRKKAFKDYDIIYKNTDAVYCIVHKERFITPIVIGEHHKIIAFFTGIVKNKDRVMPYILE